VSKRSNAMKLRRTLKYFFAVCGIALFIQLIRSVGIAKVLDSIQQIGWGTLAIVLVGGSIFVVRTLAWRLTLGREYRHLPLQKLFRVYIAAEALGFLFFGGPAVADTTRVLMLRDAVPTPRVISSVTLDRGLYLVGSVLLLAATIFLIPLVLEGKATVPTYDYVIGIIFTLMIAALWIAMRKRVRLISGFFFLASKFRPFRGWTERRRTAAAEVEHAMFHFLTTDRPGFWSAFALNLAAHGLAAFEVLLVLWFLNASRSPLAALFVEGMTKIANISGAVIPGNIGAYEAANIVILKLLGFEAAVGLVLALARDVRRLFWVGIGLALFFASGVRRIPVAELQRGPEPA
jgi:glycosyltransferase 2 family protein